MLSRLLILLMILILSSVIWWPGLNDASSFENLSELHLKDTSQKIGSMFESLTPVVESVSYKVTGAFNALLGDSYLPSTEVDGHKDAAGKRILYAPMVFALLRLDAGHAGDVLCSSHIGDRMVCVFVSDPYCRGH